MKLVNGRIKIEVYPEAEVENGLYVAPNQTTGRRFNYFRGKVVSVGVGRKCINGTEIKPTVKVDDEVIYPFGGWYTQKEDNKMYHIIFETDMWAIVEKEK